MSEGKIGQNRPVVMTKEGVYARDEGLITKAGVSPANTARNSNGAVTRQSPEPEDKPRSASRFDCVHQPKD